jgi:mono/diheme cytochrome c family protein
MTLSMRCQSTVFGMALALGQLAWVSAAAQTPVQTSAKPRQEAASVERGRYIVTIGGCNDCHTEGFIVRDGAILQTEWLKGNSLGFSGPWGTTYPPNLRIFMSALTEDQWVGYARAARARPPMPSYILREMDESDQRALYRFVRNLGDPGGPAPDFQPPGQIARGPVIQFPAAPQ